MGQAVSHLQPDQLEFKQQLRLNREKPDTAGIASPTDLLSWIQEEGIALHELINQHVISINAYSPRTLLQLFRLSAKFESNPSRYIRFNSPLKGKILNVEKALDALRGNVKGSTGARLKIMRNFQLVENYFLGSI